MKRLLHFIQTIKNSRKFVYSLIETIIFTGDTLRRALAVAALRVALRIAIVQNPSGGV